MQSQKTMDPIESSAPSHSSGASPRPKHFRWGFLSAAGMILLLMLIGQAFWTVFGTFAQDGFSVRDGLFLAFCASTLVLCYLTRNAILRFFRDMHVGVALTSIGTIAVCIGVLVPQIDGFEDPEQRVTRETYEEQYKQFRWAEGYFLYHMLNAVPIYGKVLGKGLPEADIPEPVLARLDDYGRKYGREEQKNRRIQMEAAFRSGPKSNQIRELIEQHDAKLRKAFDLATFLDLNRAYKSHWFRTLGWLLGFALMANLFKFSARKLLSVQKIGFAVTHLGMLGILIGVAFSAKYTERGILHLDLREAPKRDFWRHHDPQKPGRMPFWVRLDRFGRQDWKQLEVGFLDEDFQTRPPSYTLWRGREIDLDWIEDAGTGKLRPRIRLRVKDLAEHAHVGPPILREAGPNESGFGPLVELRVPDFDRILRASRAGTQPSELGDARRVEYLSPQIPGKELHWDMLWKFRLRAVHVGEAGRLSLDPRTLFPTPADARLGVLSVRSLGAGDVVARRLVVNELGQRFTAPGGYEVEVVEATAHHQVDPNTLSEIRDPRPLAEQAPLYPGLWVKIHAPDGRSERRLVLEQVEASQHGKQEKYEFDDLILDLEWERWANAGPPRHVLVWGGGGAPLLYSESGERRALELGTPLPLGELTNVILSRAIEDATFEKNLRFDPDVVTSGFDESFYSQDAKGLVLDVVLDPGTEHERVEEVRMATTSTSLADLWRDPENRFYLRYFENTRVMPFEWRSVLSIYEKHPEGTVRIFSGRSGEPIESLPEPMRAQVHSFYEANRKRPDVDGGLITLRDLDGDGHNDFVGPVVRVDLGPEAKREIRVNDYFKYRGYRFFQTNAIPEIPTYSGIGVVYDPGILTVLAGMYTVIGGTILAFIVRPLVENSRRRRKQAQRA